MNTNTGIDRLLKIAGPPLGAATLGVPQRTDGLRGQLSAMLSRVNGFYAFSSALHVFPEGRALDGHMGLEYWNSEQLWRREYEDMARGLFFFAEDVFGGQFALTASEVVTFDPETGATVTFAPTVQAWADALLRDFELYTGSSIAERWQRDHQPLQPGERLLPKLPFVLGGEFELDNLYPLDAIDGMKLRASIARQIRNLPEGTSIEFKIVE